MAIPTWLMLSLIGGIVSTALLLIVKEIITKIISRLVTLALIIGIFAGTVFLLHLH